MTAGVPQSQSPAQSPAPARSRLRWVALACAGLGFLLLIQLVVTVLVVGAGPQSSPAGLPDPGPVTGWGIPLLRLGADLFAVAAVAGLMVPLLVANSPGSRVRGTRREPLRFARSAILAWVLCTLGTGWLTTSDLFAIPPGGLRPGLVRNFVLDLGPGRALLVEVLLLAAALAYVSWSLRAREVARTLGLVVVALLPRVLNGHSAQSGSHDLAIFALALHVVAATVWVGGVVALGYLYLRRPDVRGVALRRFRPVATLCLVVIAVSGLVSASIRVGTVADLVGSAYGREVLVKVALLGAVVLLARRAGSTSLSAPRALGCELALMGAAFAQGVALSRTPTPVGEIYTSVSESLLGGPVRPPPDLLRLVVGFVPSGVGLTVFCFGAAGYGVALMRLRRAGTHWPAGRTIAWFAGLLVVGYATMGGLGTYSHVLFSAHMASHMLLSMVAPALLVLGAPITLALRAFPGGHGPELPGPRQLLMAVLGSRPVRLLSHPLVATALFVGSLYAIYFSAAFAALMRNHLGHAFMEFHFLAVGMLFFNVLIGVDPLPGRPPHLARLGILLVAMPFHAFFAIAVMSSSTVLGGDYYELLARPYATDLLEDQYLGGSLAWAFGEIPMLIVGLAVLAQWWTSDQRVARRRDRHEDRNPENSDLARYNEMLRQRAEASRGNR